MLAWAMNGADLPFLNGYPLRLVVPGYYGTYWVKHLSAITALDKPLDNFWMSKAYRIPDNDCNCVTDECNDEICNDGIDNDGDGDVDTQDRSCQIR